MQLHGILKSDVREVIRQINAVHLTTLAACGDVNRNVMCCPAPYHAPVYQELQELARQLAVHFAPRTGAYHDIWLRDPVTGDKQLVDGGEQEPEDEPIYGRTYLPRKFKMGIALPHDNCIDVYTHDLGLLAIVEQDRVVGYNVLVGGGMGVTPSNKKTYPALAKRLAFVEPGEVMEVAEAVCQSAARSRQSRGSQDGAAQVPCGSLGHRRLSREGGGVLRSCATAPAPGRCPRDDRSSRLGTAGRRSLVLRLEHRERTRCRHDADAAQVGLAADLPGTIAGAATDGAPEHPLDGSAGTRATAT